MGNSAAESEAFVSALVRKPGDGFRKADEAILTLRRPTPGLNVVEPEAEPEPALLPLPLLLLCVCSGFGDGVVLGCCNSASCCKFRDMLSLREWFAADAAASSLAPVAPAVGAGEIDAACWCCCAMALWLCGRGRARLDSAGDRPVPPPPSLLPLKLSCDADDDSCDRLL